MKLSDGEVLMERGNWFQICVAAVPKTRWPNLVFILGAFTRNWSVAWSKRL